MQNRVEAQVQSETFFHNGNQDIDQDGDPDLGFHRVFGGFIEGLGSKVLIDPFEEEFHPPAASIELGDGWRRKQEIAAKKGQMFLSLGVDVSDETELLQLDCSEMMRILDGCAVSLIRLKAVRFLKKRPNLYFNLNFYLNGS